MTPRPNNRFATGALTSGRHPQPLASRRGVQIPTNHPAHDGAVRVDPALAPRVFTVHSGKEKPVDAFVAVPYERLWFWIDRRNVPSKATLAAVTLLFNFLEGGSTVSPVLTIPTN